MVKFCVSKPKLSYTCKNLSGVETILKIDKQGRNATITLEQNRAASLYGVTVRWICIVLALSIVQVYILNNIITKFIVTAILVLILLYELRSTVVEETLIVVHALGYQLSCQYLLGQKDLFIPWNQVQSIFINEVIVRHKVIFLLTLLTKDEDNGDKLIPLFEEMQPRLRHLELIYKHLKDVRS